MVENSGNQRNYGTEPKLWYATACACTSAGDDVTAVCRSLACTRDAYYKRRARRGPTTGAATLALEAVDALRVAQPRMGTRKLHAQLTEAGRRIGRDRRFALLRTTGRLVTRKPRYTPMTYAHHGYAVAPNRLKTTIVTAPRQIVGSDITYLRLTHPLVYLFLVTDLYSRKIVGWPVIRDLSHHAAVLALQRAIATLGDVHGVLHHSDRGRQYGCHDHRQPLAAVRMLPSMTEENLCYQNAIAERVNGMLNDAFDPDAVFPCVSAVVHAVDQAITIYNTVRSHRSLDLQTPDRVFYQAACTCSPHPRCRPFLGRDKILIAVLSSFSHFSPAVLRARCSSCSSPVR